MGGTHGAQRHADPLTKGMIACARARAAMLRGFSLSPSAPHVTTRALEKLRAPGLLYSAGFWHDPSAGGERVMSSARKSRELRARSQSSPEYPSPLQRE